ncbi:hypothetical protein KWY15_18010 [Clostridioides difficile]|uniref:Uncharacterized protein n=6 Tax=root TaxID=1 RepID=A0A1J1J917_9CAUD|nr:hypothetical protein [Clostridioides difficile]YP_004508403.1 hypothetical protein phiCD38-2_gp25 [Clostridium phage phiCD38-2]YP_009208379.1 hypothetical protein PHICD111_20026 [Clostridium phage phiCD111]YP_009214153.1 hypothetical protein PHICD146_20025 [Clostridium phage phiCD146]ALY06969.1 hypothetical protein CDHS1_26 [Clostridium phage CDSH1]WFG79319.1 hypothetical protein JPGLOODI_00002 [Clostridioides phage AR1075-1]CUL03850.1 hypothetical protein [Clostridium phage slur17]AEF569
MKTLFKEAHKIAREIKEKYNDVDYKVQFSLCLSFLNKKGDIKMKELKGSEKQIIWANDIRTDILNLTNELEKSKIERIKNEDYKIKDMSIEEMTERCKRKFERIREAISNIEDAKFFIDNFRNVLKYNSLNQKAFQINQIFRESQFTEEIGNLKFLKGETQASHKLRKVEGSISYEEAKKIAKEINFNDNWSNEIKENVLEIVEIFDDAVKQATSTEYIEKAKKYIIETLIQKNAQFYKNGFADIKKKQIENYRKIESAERKIEIAYQIFRDGVEC